MSTSNKSVTSDFTCGENMGKALFVVGTGTDVGKTYVSGLLLKKLTEMGMQSGYYKAAVSGNERDDDGKLVPGDALTVKEISGIDEPLDKMCSYVYERAVSPHLAAAIEGNPVDLENVRDAFNEVASSYQYTIMEGSGGIMCPIRFDEKEIWLEDLITSLKLPCVLVADAGLGTINSVVLTWHYMKSKNIEPKGIIFNHYHKGDVMEEDNVKMCEYVTGLKVIGFVTDDGEDIDIDGYKLIDMFEEV